MRILERYDNEMPKDDAERVAFAVVREVVHRECFDDSWEVYHENKDSAEVLLRDVVVAARLALEHRS